MLLELNKWRAPHGNRINELSVNGMGGYDAPHFGSFSFAFPCLASWDEPPPSIFLLNIHPPQPLQYGFYFYYYYYSCYNMVQTTFILTLKFNFIAVSGSTICFATFLSKLQQQTCTVGYSWIFSLQLFWHYQCLFSYR